jgi:hypothetical protein
VLDGEHGIDALDRLGRDRGLGELRQAAVNSAICSPNGGAE